MNNKSSLYISIFKRKGGEGLETKIINNNNKRRYESLFLELEDNEQPLIIYFKNMQTWFMLTDSRTLFSDGEIHSILNNSEIIEVRPAMQEEFKEGLIDKEKFTRLKLKTKNNEYFICKIEHGLPYKGLYQVLHFIMTKNVSR
ncbi:hypothetical protein [Chryseobacterium flavum]|uniref:hypothetical protein n=1 Tax=Chryseobacterium flavum TaxID=415851 RepID=UPI0028A71564|nr:hypothetical protein [Chryseobacterium flavum]